MIGVLLQNGLAGDVELEAGHDGRCGGGGGGMAGHLALEVALQHVREELLVRHGEPEKHLLLLLRAKTAVLVEQTEEGGARGLERRMRAGPEGTQVGEDALLELLAVDDLASETRQLVRDAAHHVGPCDEVKMVPVHAGHKALGRVQIVPADDLVRVPIHGRGHKEEVERAQQTHRLHVLRHRRGSHLSCGHFKLLFQ